MPRLSLLAGREEYGLDARAYSAQAMLEALPLSTEEYGLACRRLTNAQHYLRYTEPGAAWYELRLVATSIQNAQPEGGIAIRLPAPPRSTRA